MGGDDGVSAKALAVNKLPRSCVGVIETVSEQLNY